MNVAREVGGRFLLGPLRQAATAQALIAIKEQQGPHLRSPSLRYGLRCGPPHSAGLFGRSCRPPRSLGSVAKGEVAKFKRNKSDGVFQ